MDQHQNFFRYDRQLALLSVLENWFNSLGY